MIKCKKCKVNINTNVDVCPLCKNELEKDECDTINIFPEISLIIKPGLWKKVITLVFISIMLICTAIDFITSQKITWSIFVDVAVSCIALSLLIGFMQKKNVSNLLFFEYLFLCAIVYYWDYITGQNMWSLRLVIPIISIISIFLNYILKFVFKRDYLRYFRNITISSACCIALSVLFALEIIPTYAVMPYLTIIAGVVGLLVLLVFDGKAVFEELKVRFHI